jgi:hypothetical protein
MSGVRPGIRRRRTAEIGFGWRLRADRFGFKGGCRLIAKRKPTYATFAAAVFRKSTPSQGYIPLKEYIREKRTGQAALLLVFRQENFDGS